MMNSKSVSIVVREILLKEAAAILQIQILIQVSYLQFSDGLLIHLERTLLFTVDNRQLDC